MQGTHSYSPAKETTPVDNRQKFGYDMITSMVSGSEATESAIKIARKWAYTMKGIPRNEAWILTTSHCFHGLTLATMPLSDIIADSKIPFKQNIRFICSY